jgi:hypothetical protein
MVVLLNNMNLNKWKKLLITYNVKRDKRETITG